MVCPEGAGILQEHPAVITTGGVNMCPHVMPLSLPLGQEGKRHQSTSSPPADPSVKRVPGLVLGKENSLAMHGHIQKFMLNIILSCNQSAQWFDSMFSGLVSLVVQTVVLNFVCGTF